MISSHILGYRKSTEKREQSLLFVIEWLKSIGDIEIIICEQSAEKRFKDIDGVKYLNIKDDGLYNRGKVFNVAFAKSSCDNVVFSDADIIMNKTDYMSCVEKLKEYPCVCPFTSLTNVEEISIDCKSIVGEYEKTGYLICGGLVMYKKQEFVNIGGWDERFVGWGAEDDWMSHKTERHMKYIKLDYKAYHINHERTILDGNGQPQYKANLELLNSLKNYKTNDEIEIGKKRLEEYANQK